MSWITYWLWSSTTNEEKKSSVPPQRLKYTHNVTQKDLDEIKSKLRPVQTRVSPSDFPIRIPHIAEMAALQKEYHVDKNRRRRNRQRKNKNN